MRRFVNVLLALAGAAALVVACSSESASGPQTLCQAGENIFCRCRGGAPGTKTCKASGASFDACVSSEGGDCTEVVDPSTTTAEASSSEAATTTTATTGVGGGSSTSTTASGTGGGPLKALLDPCVSGVECETGLCPMGFCSDYCVAYTDCILGDIYGDCVELTLGSQTDAWCVPYCSSQADCDVYGAPSTCDYALMVDVQPFHVCADWPPYGTECGEDDIVCSLGAVGAERVCAFGACTEGCYSGGDCPLDSSCSSSVNLGVCQ